MDPRGLTNLGNTCFLNACVQALSQTLELTKIPFNQNEAPEKEEDLFHKTWRDLNMVLLQGDPNIRVVSPTAFVRMVQMLAHKKGRTLFTGFAQNDVSEFLLFFVESIHDTIKRSININIQGTAVNETDKLAIQCYKLLENKYKSEYSEIMDIFYGISVSSLENGGKTKSVNPEFFFILDLPIPTNSEQPPSLYQCLDAYTSPELLENENAWYNDTTNEKESVYKKISFWNFPHILVISLKRFEVVDGRFIRKYNGLIPFPIENLDLSKYVIGYNKSSFVYDLYGVCNHSGDVMGGHYTAFVKTIENKWFHCNDTGVEQVERPENVVTPLAYCLFYRKKNNSV
jgi:ubiquitin C-terminal hydrolase